MITTNRSDDTRQRILECAVRHFSRQGYAATNLMQIAEEVGVTRGPLYYYFSNKAELYHAAVEHVIAQMQADYAAILTQDQPILQVIRDDYLCCLKDKGLFFRAGTGGKDEPDSSEEWRVFNEWLIARKYEVFSAAKKRGEIPEDCDLSELITFIYTFYNGIMSVKSLAENYEGFSRQILDHSEDMLMSIIRERFIK